MLDQDKEDDKFIQSSSQDIFKKIKENIGPGITVALVSVPLSSALSIASLCTP